MATPDNPMEWIEPLKALAKKNAGSEAALARRIGCARKAISDWNSVQLPNLPNFIGLLRAAGGDVILPLGAGGDGVEQETEQVKLWGQVEAGGVAIEGQGTAEIAVPLIPDSLRRYVWPLWDLTTGETIYLQVQGRSMYPVYHSSAIIACRKPRNGADIPEGTPCVFEEDGLFTFKLLQTGNHHEIIGEPINRDHGYIVFRKTKVSMPYVVLGQVNPGAVRRAIVDNRTHTEIENPKATAPEPPPPDDVPTIQQEAL